VPFHRQECFSYLNSKDQDYPFADSASSNSLPLPIYPELSAEQISYVVNSILEFHNTTSERFMGTSDADRSAAYGHPLEVK
jgi:dTDP-4-amino-4,6-dideoxygalactose transaminase